MTSKQEKKLDNQLAKQVFFLLVFFMTSILFACIFL